jgi:hypothetical protein
VALKEWTISTEVLVSVTSLLGVLLGGGLSLFGQRSLQSAADRRDRAALRERLRNHAVIYIEKFLMAAQEVERHAIARHHDNIGLDRLYGDATKAIDDFWAAQKVLSIVLPNLEQLSLDVTLASESALWEGPGTAKVWDYLRGHRDAFLAGARAEVDLTLYAN